MEGGAFSFNVSVRICVLLMMDMVGFRGGSFFASFALSDEFPRGVPTPFL